MNLQVEVKEARNLPAADSNGLSDPYVLVQLGSTKQKTSVVCKSLNPSWNETFTFKVGDIREELIFTIWDQDRFTDDFLGQLKIPVTSVLEAVKHSLPLSWYPLQKRHSWSKTPVSGEILLAICLYGNHGSALSSIHGVEISEPSSTRSADRESISATSQVGSLTLEPSSRAQEPDLVDSLNKHGSSPEKLETPHQTLAKKITVMLKRGFESPPQRVDDESVSLSELSRQRTESLEGSDEQDSTAPDSFFDDQDPSDVESYESNKPAVLAGGILLDQRYAVSVKALNAILFKPGCQFYRDLFALQKATNVVELPWMKSGGGLLHRVVTYTKAATKLVKAVEVTEDHTYIRADRDCYAVIESVSTPDVPYGSYFRTELLFVMTPLSDLPPGEVGTHLTISWRINFLESTFMKGVIENGARQGLKENFQQFAELLPKYAQPVNTSGNQSGISELEVIEPNSNLQLAFQYFGNIRVLFTLVMAVFVLVHVGLANSSRMEGLEFWVLDMPDSLVEIITTAIVVLLVERLVMEMRHFLYARYRRGCDHGVKAVGDGWLLSVALVEGVCLAPVDNNGSSDPYVVFKCNGKKRTSSVKLQTLNPHWQEIFEFDATEDPPSTMEVEIFDFEGPFVDPVSLGHAKINFLKYSSDEMADMWIPLDGSLARSFGSRIHLRVSLKNTKEHDNVTQYIAKMEKEVGTKILRRSPERNSSFQKLFLLPSEEFLIDDFSCALKRTVPLQGRLFFSPRMLGFYSNLFGRKTKLSFLWEDIEDIKELSALRTMESLFNPSLLICVKKGRGSVASQYAKKMDDKGRLYYQFQSFVKFGTASRMITTLWKNRALTPEERMKKLGNMEKEGESLQARLEDDSDTFLGLEEANMTEVYFTKFPFKVELMLMMFEKEQLDEKIMEKTGFLNYTTTTWESVGSRIGVHQRQQNFKLSSRLLKNSSEITCIQQKTVLEDKRLCIIDELLTFQDAPLGDNFQLQIRKEIENLRTDSTSCTCRLYIGIAWRKSSKYQKKITKNISEEFTKLLKDYLNVAVKEILKAKGESVDISL